MNRKSALLGTSAGAWAEPKRAGMLPSMMGFKPGGNVDIDSPEGKRALDVLRKAGVVVNTGG